jgi:hypothetical protein
MLCRCPLCLQDLGEGQQIARFCPSHPDSSEQFLVSDAAGDAVACPMPGCRSYGLVGSQGLMLRHVGCSYGRNPFWDEQTNKVSVNEYIVSPVTSAQEIVGHWEIDTLRLAGQHAPAADMWFPAPLLLKERDAVQARSHVLVDFTGARGVGKTFLAMHALDEAGYKNGAGYTGDFIYSSPAAGGGDGAREFLLTLRLRERMALNQQYDQWIRMSVVRPRNLKVAFFAAERKPAAGQKPPQSGWRQALTVAYHDIAKVFVNEAPRSAHRALLIYDIAGETAERFSHQTIAEHDQHMDVLAVLVSAEDMAANAARELDSVYLARHRLAQIAQSKQHTDGVRCALIVTKCDLWPDRPAEPTLESLKAFAETSTAHPALRDLVRRCLPDNHGGSPLVDRVYFTWPDTSQGTLSPVIHGLEGFVTWCFES